MQTLGGNCMRSDFPIKYEACMFKRARESMLQFLKSQRQAERTCLSAQPESMLQFFEIFIGNAYESGKLKLNYYYIIVNIIYVFFLQIFIYIYC